MNDCEVLTPEIPAALVPRGRERRTNLHDLLRLVAGELQDGRDASSARRALEEAVCRLVPVRLARIRDGTFRGVGARRASEGSEGILLDVPRCGGSAGGVVEVRFDPPSGLGDWDLQILDAVCQLSALVFEIERARGQSGRVASRPKRDAARVLVGTTAAMQRLRATIDRVADTDFTILLEGESGVGKELVAREIHELSRRRNGPFVAINCAALVETLVEAELFGIEDRIATGVRARRGKFEQADGGTLFLDEVSDLSLSAQAKLLRAVQDLAVERVGGHSPQRVDVRIVAATNRSLRGLVDQQLFRPDLYYRLSGVDVRVPTLRERQDDIPVLVRHFLTGHNPARPLRVSTGAADALVAYDWPGNVRELERVLERAVAFAESDVLELQDLPPCVLGDFADTIGPALGRGDTMRAWGSRYARLVLDRCKGNKREACRILGISYHTLVAYLNYRGRRGTCQEAYQAEREEETAEETDA